MYSVNFLTFWLGLFGGCPVVGVVVVGVLLVLAVAVFGSPIEASVDVGVVLLPSVFVWGEFRLAGSGCWGDCGVRTGLRPAFCSIVTS